MEERKSFLGKGWSFPPEFSRQSKGIKMLADEADIESSLHILLTTQLGERIMQPNYGCDLDSMQFETLSLTQKTYISDLIRTAILYHEPRIDVVQVYIDTTDELNGVLLINIEYTVRSTNTRRNMVYPFYKIEATEI